VHRRRAFTLVELLVVMAIIAVLISTLMPALNKGREHARFVVCKTRHRNYAFAAFLYLPDNNGVFPEPRSGLYGWDPLGQVQRGCLWHDEANNLYNRPDLAGPLWPYLEVLDTNLCPTFEVLARQGSHSCGIPMEPQRSFSQNALLGSGYGISKESEVERPAQTFFYAEENPFECVPGVSSWAINATFLVAFWALSHRLSEKRGFTDSFASFHHAPAGDVTAGVGNAAFIDGHVETVVAEDTYYLARPTRRRRMP